MITLLITGGAGFIGSNYINTLDPNSVQIVNLDRLDYCSSLANINHTHHPNYHFVRGSIGDYSLVLHVLHQYSVDIVVHFAAQTHVDNSFQNSLTFTEDNVKGTHVLLEACREYGKITRFLNFSTDEVLGQSDHEQTVGFTEDQILCPTNPYAATKCGAEMLGKSFFHSYKMPIITTRCNNVYGPGQYPEKLIPRFILRRLAGQKLLVQGAGKSKRMFIHVDDVCSAVSLILELGKLGQIYHIGTEIKHEFSVLEITEKLVSRVPNFNSSSKWQDELEFIPDRDFNDQRYFLCNQKLKNLGWVEKTSFDDGLQSTIEWYRLHQADYRVI